MTHFRFQVGPPEIEMIYSASWLPEPLTLRRYGDMPEELSAHVRALILARHFGESIDSPTFLAVINFEIAAELKRLYDAKILWWNLFRQQWIFELHDRSCF